VKAPAQSSRANGFTLLEILVAVSVLGIALVSLLGLHARNITLTAETQDMTMAAMLASRIVAVTKAGRVPEEGLVEGKFTAQERDSFRFDEMYGGEGSERFVWTREVVNAASLLPGLFLVRVAVGPPDAAPSVELRFAMADKARILRSFKAAARARSSSEP
jgi:prepilin-type N-terminal cleavage/methylation domain-containing protein